jgi:hypothetical protein
VQPWNDIMNSPETNAQWDHAAAVVLGIRTCTPETGASETVHESEPVLQWTTRLRDFLVEENRYEIDALSFAMKMKEAEFIPQPSQGELAEPSKKRLCTGTGATHSVEPGASDVSFPPEFDFETFLQYYKEGSSCPFAVHKPNSGINRRYANGGSIYSRDDFRPYERLAVQNRGKPVTTKNRDITVLWLSPTVFISSHMFACSFDAQFSSLCTVSLIIRPIAELGEIDETFVYELKKSVIEIHVYSIDPSMRCNPKISCPHLPFLFLKHLLHPLPVDYFSAVEYTQLVNPLESTSYPVFLWSIFRSKTPPPLQPLNFQDYTEIRLKSEISYDQLLGIVAHRFNPYTRLVLCQFDEDTVGASELNRVLRFRCHNTPHLQLPNLLLSHDPFVSDNEDPFTENEQIRTLTTDWCDDISTFILDGIPCYYGGIHSLNVRLKYEQSTLDSRAEHEALDRVGDYIVRCVLLENSTLSELSLTYDAGEQLFLYFQQEITKRLCRMSYELEMGRLCHISVVKAKRSTEDDGMIWRPHVVTNRLSWDKVIAPVLMSNWLFQQSKSMQQSHQAPATAVSRLKMRRVVRPVEWSTRASFHALQIRAINEGILYRKTTEQVPCEIGTGNSTVIYTILHGLFVSESS